MKPRWKIDPLCHVQFVYGYRPSCQEAKWLWVRRDRNGAPSVVGCVCHHSWTKRVSAGQVITNASP